MTHHIDEVLECDGGGASIGDALHQLLDLVYVDVGPKVGRPQRHRKVVPRNFAEAFRIELWHFH